MSMNGCINGDSWYTDEIDKDFYIRKQSAIIVPSNKYVFWITPRCHRRWLPSDLCQSGASVGQHARQLPQWGRASPADGHSEIKKWQDPDTLQDHCHQPSWNARCTLDSGSDD